jgi:hypothetical protein
MIAEDSRERKSLYSGSHESCGYYKIYQINKKDRNWRSYTQDQQQCMRRQDFLKTLRDISEIA